VIHKVLGHGAKGNPFAYLLKKERSVAAEVVRGDPELCWATIRSLSYRQKYTSLVLSCAEQLPPERERQIIDDYERTAFAGRPEEFVRVWVRHREHGRTELHLVVANVHLPTGKRWSHYYDRADRRLFKAWQELTNLRHGLASPDAPERVRLADLPGKLPADKRPSNRTEQQGQALQFVVGQTTKKGYSVAGFALPGDITTANTYDGAGHVTQQDITGGTLSLRTTAAFDLAGRPTQEVQYASSSANTITTGYSYSSGGRVATATLPGGAQRITESYFDGQLKEVRGDVVRQNASYSVNSSTGNITAATYAGGVTAATINTTTDWLGRKISVTKPAWNNGTATYSWFYNTNGQLWKYTQPGSSGNLADTLYTYDTLGRLYREGLDLNANGALDPASLDRITEQGWTYVNSSGWWLRQTTSTYAQDNNGAATQTAKVETRIDLPGNRLSYVNSFDIFGNVTASYQDVDRTNHKITTTTDTSDSNVNAVSIAYNGLLVQATDTAGITMKYGFDALGRQTQSIDPRTGTTNTAYISNTSLVDNVKDPSNVAQATYTYDAAGRVATATDALNKVARYDYTLRGEKQHEWGDTTTPVEYGYDSTGRQTTMKTFRAGSGWTGSSWPSGSTGTADITKWVYDDATGLLKEKYDSANLDSSGNPIPGAKKVSFTYTQAGQINTRTWARGVVTTYGYSTSTGELTGVSYSNDPTSTTALTYTYNRLGQAATVADYTGTRSFTYNLAGTLELQYEDLPAYLNNRRITYGYDTTAGVAGRLNALKLGNSGNATADQSIGYGYQSDGRFYSLAAGGQTFTYGYTSNSHLVSTVSNSGVGFTDSRGYDPSHDWVDSRSTTVSSVTKASFGYLQDFAGRVTSVAKTGELFNVYGNGSQGLSTNFGYNDRSEVTDTITYLGGTGTVLTGRTDAPGGYTYDNAGNRTNTWHNMHPASYQINALNQCVSRNVPIYFDVAGFSTGTTVTVSKSGGPTDTAARHGQYFFDGYPLSSGPQPTYANLSVTVDGVLSQTLPVFSPGSDEPFAYDDDGNLTSDGRWNYTYDAENRLKSMETKPSAVTAGVPRQWVNTGYDYLGRRVGKNTFSGWNGSSYTVTDFWGRYVYQGWNPIAQIDPNTGNIAKSFYWGVDLSGTMQGAGGVGGLLMVQDGGQSYLPMYDGNGNVMGMIKASDGSIAAAYEYDAFGQTIRESGPWAANNPFRFSTKYTDLESGLVYYGKRYYSPSLGRFVNRDPIEEQGGLNLYLACVNNLVNNWDYLGQVVIIDSKYSMNDNGTVYFDYGRYVYGPNGRSAGPLDFYQPVPSANFTGVLSNLPTNAEAAAAYNATMNDLANGLGAAMQPVITGNMASVDASIGSWGTSFAAQWQGVIDSYAAAGWSAASVAAAQQSQATYNSVAAGISSIRTVTATVSIGTPTVTGWSYAPNNAAAPTATINVVTEIRPPYIEAGVKSNQTVVVNTNNGQIVSSTYNTGTTQLFGIDFSARQLGTNGFSATSTLQNGSTYVTLNGETGSKFVPLNINYNLTVGYNPNTQSAIVLGTHDGFPSYVVTVNGTQVLNFQQTGGVLNLAGSGGVTVVVPPTKVNPPPPANGDPSPTH